MNLRPRSCSSVIAVNEPAINLCLCNPNISESISIGKQLRASGNGAFRFWPTADAVADYGEGRGGGSQLRHHFRRPAYNDALTKAGTRGSAPFESSRCPLDAESHILARFLASVLVDWPGIATVPMCIRIENTGIYVIVTKQRTSGRQTVAQVSFPLIRHLLSLSLPPSFSVPRRTYSLPLLVHQR